MTAFQGIAFLFELPPPAEAVVGLANPVEQTTVFNQAGPAIHALGIRIAIGEPAVQA